MTMGRYTEAEKCIERWSSLQDLGETYVESWGVALAENELDARLGVAMVTPFSSDNVTAMDLSMWLTYLRLANLSKEEQSRHGKTLEDRIARILAGDELMATTSGTLASAGGTVWSTTEGYAPIFGLGAVEDMGPDPDQLCDEARRREY